MPDQLQYLRVDFAGAAGVFASGPGYQQALRNLGHKDNDKRLLLIKPAYRWMTELVDSGQGLRRLKKLAVIETPELARPSYSVDGLMAWTIPTPLVDAFRAARVILKIQLKDCT